MEIFLKGILITRQNIGSPIRVKKVSPRKLLAEKLILEQAPGSLERDRGFQLNQRGGVFFFFFYAPFPPSVSHTCFPIGDKLSLGRFQ